MDEIDRVLSNEKVVVPSAEFASRVMGAVREQAAAPPPIEFPWQRFLPGFFTSVALVFATFMVMGWTAPAVDPATAPDTARFALGELLTPLGRGLVIAAGALTASLALVWFVVRSGRRNAATGL